MTISTVESTRIKEGGRLVKVIRFGKADVQEVDEVAPFGIDGNPLENMNAIHAETAARGEAVVVGYINLEQLAEPGELRIYSLKEDGMVACHVWLKADGTIEMQGIDTHVLLKPDGTMELGGSADNAVRYSKLETAFNKLKDDFNAFVQTYNGHTHVTSTAVPAFGTHAGSTVPTTAAGQPSTADISPAKIEEIKTP